MTVLYLLANLMNFIRIFQGVFAYYACCIQLIIHKFLQYGGWFPEGDQFIGWVLSGERSCGLCGLFCGLLLRISKTSFTFIMT